MFRSNLNGKKRGNFQFYYPNGKLKMSINYQDDERIGVWKEYYENGNLRIELEYEVQKEKLFSLKDNNFLFLGKTPTYFPWRLLSASWRRSEGASEVSPYPFHDLIIDCRYSNKYINST